MPASISRLAARSIARRFAPLAVLTTVLLSACGILESEDPRVDGIYEGRTTIEDRAWDVRLALTEASSNVVRGAGSMRQVQTDRTISFQIQGVHTFPDLTLTLKSSGFPDKDFTGTVSGGGDSLGGVLRDRNFSAEIGLQRGD